MKAISEFEPDVQKLAECLREASISEIVTYERLDKVLGRSVQDNRYILVRARTTVEKEIGAVFGTVFRVGLKRMPVEDFPTVGQYSRRAIRRRARKASDRMANGLAKINDAPADIVRAVSREQSILGLIQYACRDSTMKRLLTDEFDHSTNAFGTCGQGFDEGLGRESA